jgi:hypothetical protein
LYYHGLPSHQLSSTKSFTNFIPHQHPESANRFTMHLDLASALLLQISDYSDMTKDILQPSTNTANRHIPLIPFARAKKIQGIRLDGKRGRRP